MKIDDLQIKQEIIEQNQRLMQNLNTQRHNEFAVRQLISEIIGQKIDESTKIRAPFFTDYGRNIKLGKRVIIESGVVMKDLGGITIDDDVQIETGVVLTTIIHPMDAKLRKQLHAAPIKIAKNVLIEAKTIIMPGVIIGENAVIKPGAVVEENVAANTVVGGNPAKFIKKI